MGRQRRIQLFATGFWRLVALAAFSMSCGGSAGNSNGDLCQPCAGADLPCKETTVVTGNNLPSFCTTDPCTVYLTCLHKFQSRARVCYPAANKDLTGVDEFYRCQGDRPDPNG